MTVSRWLRAPGQAVKIMGVLNCTPDSFSDGGRFIAEPESADLSDMDVAAAVRSAVDMVEAGAHIIDVGGESTRPGAAPVSLDDELARVIPVIRDVSAIGTTVSIDTMKAEVMRQAVKAGATLINDVSALTADLESLAVAADSRVDICLMHMQGRPESMQENPSYNDVVDEVCHYLEGRVEAAVKAGVSESSILVDPGIGFGKRMEDNLALIAGLGLMKSRLGLPLLMGVSRKSFLGMITDSEVDDREIETAAAVAVSIFAGADVVRVHDVKSQRRAAEVAVALRDAAFRLA
jgi:dihydropteroate synthase